MTQRRHSFQQTIHLFFGALLIAISLAVNSHQVHAQTVVTTPDKAAFDSTELAVLTDLLSNDHLSGWNRSGTRICLDPYVTPYPRAKNDGMTARQEAGNHDGTTTQRTAGAPRRQWPEQMLSELLRLPFVALDSTVGRLPTGGARCARSFATARLAYGRPTVVNDTGNVVFVATRLDTRAQVDSFMHVLRLTRLKGKWYVVGLGADAETAHVYVRGDGCYRLSHPPFIYGMRVDTVLIRADSQVFAPNPNSFPLHKLAPGSLKVGLGGPPSEWSSFWSVSHDSVHFVWNALNSQLSVDVLITGDSLSGSMTYETDAVTNNPPRVPVTGKRVGCS